MYQQQILLLIKVVSDFFSKDALCTICLRWKYIRILYIFQDWIEDDMISFQMNSKLLSIVSKPQNIRFTKLLGSKLLSCWWISQDKRCWTLNDIFSPLPSICSEPDIKYFTELWNLTSFKFLSEGTLSRFLIDWFQSSDCVGFDVILWWNLYYRI